MPKYREPQKKKTTKVNPVLHPDSKLGKVAKSVGDKVKTVAKTIIGGPLYMGYEAIKKKRVESGMDSYKKGGYVKSKSKTWSNRANQYD